MTSPTKCDPKNINISSIHKLCNPDQEKIQLDNGSFAYYDPTLDSALLNEIDPSLDDFSGTISINAMKLFTKTRFTTFFDRIMSSVRFAR